MNFNLVFKVKSGTMNNISEIAMTIFPEVANPIDPPQTYFSDAHIKIRVIEVVSRVFEEKMGELFNRDQLLVFLNSKREEIRDDMVGDLIAHYSHYEPEEEENTEQNLEDCIMENIDGYIGDIDEWIYEFVRE